MCGPVEGSQSWTQDLLNLVRLIQNTGKIQKETAF